MESEYIRVHHTYLWGTLYLCKVLHTYSVKRVLAYMIQLKIVT
jgi:hypothetical protein